jgi:hypothetical protein
MADYPRRAVRVFLRPVIEVETLVALPPLLVQPLVHGIVLPEVEVIDDRPARQKTTRRELGPVEAPAESTAEEAA